MKKLLANLVFAIFGWKTDVGDINRLQKCVLIAAPHTSNWDFVFSLATFWKYGIRFNFFIKDSYTKSAFGFVFKALGAIGVDRSKNSNLVEFAAEKIRESEQMILMVPAEGSRSYVEKWKTGFYHIAKLADVPIALGFLDFEKKIAGVGPLVSPSENQEKDFTTIQDFYKDLKGKHPEKYNPNIF